VDLFAGGGRPLALGRRPFEKDSDFVTSLLINIAFIRSYVVVISRITGSRNFIRFSPLNTNNLWHLNPH
jgi:hypothetical protein